MGLDVTNTDAMKVHCVCQINHPTKPQAACSHLTRKLPASWHLVSLKAQGINPCGVVQNYFDLECKMEFVTSSVQTLALVFFLNVYACVRSLGSYSHLAVVFTRFPSSTPPNLSLPSSSCSSLLSFSLPHYQAMCCSHPFSFPFSSNRATGAGGLEITCAVLCFRPDTVINHCPSHTSTYNNKDWLLCGGCRPIAFHCANAKLEVNGHSQILLPCPQTVSSFRYLSISALSVELLSALPRGLRLLGGGSELVLRLFGFDSLPISWGLEANFPQGSAGFAGV